MKDSKKTDLVGNPLNGGSVEILTIRLVEEDELCCVIYVILFLYLIRGSKMGV